MDIILSIHSKYAKEIVNGSKRFEYRKSHFKFPIDHVFLYETSPIKIIRFGFDCSGIIHDDPKKVWESTHKYAGLSKQDFFDYYSNSRSATVIKVGKTFKISPLKIIDFGFKRAPMSYYYVR